MEQVNFLQTTHTNNKEILATKSTNVDIRGTTTATSSTSYTQQPHYKNHSNHLHRCTHHYKHTLLAKSLLKTVLVTSCVCSSNGNHIVGNVTALRETYCNALSFTSFFVFLIFFFSLFNFYFLSAMPAFGFVHISLPKFIISVCYRMAIYIYIYIYMSNL